MSINIDEKGGLIKVRRKSLSNNEVINYLNKKYKNQFNLTDRKTIIVNSKEFVMSVLRDTSNEPSNKRLQGSSIKAASSKNCDLIGLYPIISNKNEQIVSVLFVLWKKNDIPKNKKNPSVKVKVEEIYSSYVNNIILYSKQNHYPAEIIPESLFLSEKFDNKSLFREENDNMNVKNQHIKEKIREVDRSQEIKTEILNIQPNASILNVFSRLSYKPWYALAEFVDNSTQSFLSNKDELMRSKSNFKLKIEIVYDETQKVLTIIDNAFGMDHQQFKNAILLDSKNENQVGRNEFGMGLKTAASWFGNIWSVESSQYGSKYEYYASINIPQLQITEQNSTEIKVKEVLPEKHGTIIKIADVTKPIVGGRTIGKIKELLSSMYRRDLKSNVVEIWFNGMPIKFEEYPILEDYKKKNWKKNIDFNFDFDGISHNVTGFVAIMNPGSFGKAGFALFRHNRVVIGGLEQNYKPSEIFGQAQSQISLKLFGELDVNSFPVNQAKDGFVWDNGLEEAFIEALKRAIHDYIKVADLSKKIRDNQEQYSETNSVRINENVQKALDNISLNNSGAIYEKKPDNLKNTDIETQEVFEFMDHIDHVKSEPKSSNIGTSRKYDIEVEGTINGFLNIEVKWVRGNNADWIEISHPNEESINVELNIEHVFFMPYSQDEIFKEVLEKFAIAFSLAEWTAQQGTRYPGYVYVDSINNYLNNFLTKVGDMDGKI